MLLKTKQRLISIVLGGVATNSQHHRGSMLVRRRRYRCTVCFSEMVIENTTRELFKDRRMCIGLLCCRFVINKISRKQDKSSQLKKIKKSKKNTNTK